MSIRRNEMRGIFFSLFLVLLSCSTGPVDDPIPIVNFPDSTLNLSAPEYASLLVDGGYKIVSAIAGHSVGVRGIILYRKDKNTYIAYEINCSYHPNEAASNVGVHSSGLFMVCSGCTSNFSFADGKPTGGPAWRALRIYNTDLSSNSLTITSTIVN